ncbi:MAG TPA: class II aldolase/adducin family protein [Caulobacteraceae bacterium]|jgi:L-fuculose-phosphate aldolase|nr:class II aldolase/adducin family protein [Caulobacteraceae bacterium]
MAADEADLRRRMVQVMQAMDQRGLNRGTSGNVSARFDEGLLVTPSGIPAGRLEPEQMVLIDADGQAPNAGLKPSSEWRMHQRLLQRRPDANAVVHCHSRHATILACAGRAIPSLHYMVAVAGGASVPLAPYATFGSSELADGVVDALEGLNAALMANHGQVALGRSLEAALSIAEEVEEQAAVYCGTMALGGPILLSEAEMSTVLDKFKSYGQRR